MKTSKVNAGGAAKKQTGSDGTTQIQLVHNLVKITARDKMAVLKNEIQKLRHEKVGVWF